MGEAVLRVYAVRAEKYSKDPFIAFGTLRDALDVAARMHPEDEPGDYVCELPVFGGVSDAGA